jgi:hypothetical protein
MHCETTDAFLRGDEAYLRSDTFHNQAVWLSFHRFLD